MSRDLELVVPRERTKRGNWAFLVHERCRLAKRGLRALSCVVKHASDAARPVASVAVAPIWVTTNERTTPAGCSIEFRDHVAHRGPVEFLWKSLDEGRRSLRLLLRPRRSRPQPQRPGPPNRPDATAAAPGADPAAVAATAIAGPTPSKMPTASVATRQADRRAREAPSRLLRGHRPH